jgi:hypothetical protein
VTVAGGVAAGGALGALDGTAGGAAGPFGFTKGFGAGVGLGGGLGEVLGFGVADGESLALCTPVALDTPLVIGAITFTSVDFMAGAIVGAGGPPLAPASPLPSRAPGRSVTNARSAITHAATAPPTHTTPRFVADLPSVVPVIFVTAVAVMAARPMRCVGCLRGSIASAIRTGRLGTSGTPLGAITASACARAASSPATTIAPLPFAAAANGAGTASRASMVSIRSIPSKRPRSFTGSAPTSGAAPGSYTNLPEGVRILGSSS